MSEPTRIRFSQLLLEMGSDREAFLAGHRQPALLIEPYDEFTHGFDTRTEPISMLGKTDLALEIADVVSDGIHPQACIDWLQKSDRNPFAGLITLGRASNNDIILGHPTISKLHAMFHHQGDAWLVEDRNSTNGTFLQGLELERGSRHELTDGVRMCFGAGIIARFLLPATLWEFCNLMGHEPKSTDTRRGASPAAASGG